MSNTDKQWMTLNAHGKYCLSAFIYAISGTDLLTSQLDYLVGKDLVDNRDKFNDWMEREEVAAYCLTDLGMHTAKHYFPKFTNWDKANLKIVKNNHNG